MIKTVLAAGVVCLPLSFAGDKLIGADSVLTLLGSSKPLHLTVDRFFAART